MALLQLEPEAYAAGWGGEPSTASEADVDVADYLAKMSRMDDLWGPILGAGWRATPVTSGRTASQSDVEDGRAVFYIPSGSVPHQIALPACGIHRDVETGNSTPIVVIQAESVGDLTMLGSRLLSGGTMVCTLAEVELLTEPTPDFFST